MNFYKNKKVTITGGAGFIGSHLAQELVNQGAQVTILDNLSTGKEENISEIINFIEFIKGDIRDKDACNQAFKNSQVIFHLAAFISVPQSIEKPYDVYKLLKDYAFNVKTDINYPNKYRPRTNPGYGTEYRPHSRKKRRKLSR